MTVTYIPPKLPGQVEINSVLTEDEALLLTAVLGKTYGNKLEVLFEELSEWAKDVDPYSDRQTALLAEQTLLKDGADIPWT
jgi:hypothetical protein